MPKQDDRAMSISCCLACDIQILILSGIKVPLLLACLGSHYQGVSGASLAEPDLLVNMTDKQANPGNSGANQLRCNSSTYPSSLN